MTRLRPLLSAILGLFLLIQGFAVATSGYAPAAQEEAAAQEAQLSALPCHGDDDSTPGGASCCDADCPNMTICALGHLGLAPVVQLAFGPAESGVGEYLAPAPVTPSPQSPLRPPIALHA